MQESLRLPSAERMSAEPGVSPSELEFRRLLELLPAAAYMCDAEGLITYFNATAARLWGREPRLDHADDRYCGSFKLFYPDGRPMRHDECWMALALQQEREFNGQEVVIECSDGRRVTALAHANPIRDSEGRLRGAVNVLVDISDRKKAEDALRGAVQARTDFLATLSHELRNPLAPIRNALDILHDRRADPDLTDAARETIERQLGHLVRLVDELLDVSRIDRGKLRLQVQRVSLRAVVDRALETVATALEQRGQRVDVRLPAESVEFEGDPVRLGQVLQNLLDNAGKYSADNATIVLEGSRADDGLSIEVRDQGIGIPGHQLESIFEPFAQLDRTLERENAGLGIGLTLVRRLVELHGGTVTASSDGPDSGSRFVVWLPLGAANVEEAAATSRAAAPEPSRRRVLVADDNRDSAETLAALLELSGHEVHVAYDGQQALELVDELAPDVVVLDIAMPRMSGYDAAKRIRERAATPPLLIAMTGWGQPEDMERSREAGFDHHLVKPLDPGQLRELLANGERAQG